VLAALKAGQIAATAPVAPVAPVAEEDDEEHSADGGMNNELLQDGMLGTVLGGAAGAALTKSPGGAMAGAKLGSATQDAFGEETAGSCNYTAEGEHCPEHGLNECGSMYEGEQDTIARLRKLSGMPHSETDMTETYRVPDTEDRRRFIRHNIWTVMDSDEEVMQYPVEGNPFFSAKKLMRKLDDEGYDFTHVISPEGRITYSPQHDPRHLKNFPDNQVDEGQEDSPVASAITRRILLQRSDLLSKYGPEKVMAAIDDVADFVGDTDEIGSSDVSGWIKQVEQSLAGMAEEVAVTTGNPPLEETTALQGQYGHSGKLQKFDAVEDDILSRLKQLSGLIRL
jgi:hypothetical protein